MNKIELKTNTQKLLDVFLQLHLVDRREHNLESLTSYYLRSNAITEADQEEVKEALRELMADGFVVPSRSINSPGRVTVTLSEQALAAHKGQMKIYTDIASATAETSVEEFKASLIEAEETLFRFAN